MKNFLSVLTLALLSCTAAYAAEVEAPVPTQEKAQAQTVQADQPQAPAAPVVEVELGAEPTWMSYESCIAECFTCFNECVSLCQPPDFDGHPTFTACKLTCRQDLEACKADC